MPAWMRIKSFFKKPFQRRTTAVQSTNQSGAKPPLVAMDVAAQAHQKEMSKTRLFTRAELAERISSPQGKRNLLVSDLLMDCAKTTDLTKKLLARREKLVPAAEEKLAQLLRELHGRQKTEFALEVHHASIPNSATRRAEILKVGIVETAIELEHAGVVSKGFVERTFREKK